MQTEAGKELCSPAGSALCRSAALVPASRSRIGRESGTRSLEGGQGKEKRNGEAVGAGAQRGAGRSLNLAVSIQPSGIRGGRGHGRRYPGINVSVGLSSGNGWVNGSGKAFLAYGERWRRSGQCFRSGRPSSGRFWGGGPLAEEVATVWLSPSVKTSPGASCVLRVAEVRKGRSGRICCFSTGGY